MDKEEVLSTLESVIANYPKGTKEYKALTSAAIAIAELNYQKVKTEYEESVMKNDASLSGLQLLHLLICDIEIPQKLLSPKGKSLKIEIEEFSKRLLAYKGG